MRRSAYSRQPEIRRTRRNVRSSKVLPAECDHHDCSCCYLVVRVTFGGPTAKYQILGTRRSRRSFSKWTSVRQRQLQLVPLCSATNSASFHPLPLSLIRRSTRSCQSSFPPPSLHGAQSSFQPPKIPLASHPGRGSSAFRSHTRDCRRRRSDGAIAASPNTPLARPV